MVDIRPNALPAAILPLRTGDAVIVDQGADGVRQTNPVSFTDSVAPVSTQAEAQTGTDNTKRMTPLRTKQSIASEVGVTLASSAQGTKADSAVQSVNGKSGNSITLAKGDLGLGNVDNTSDENKPISISVQSALNLKANDSEVVKSVNNFFPVNGNIELPNLSGVMPVISVNDLSGIDYSLNPSSFVYDDGFKNGLFAFVNEDLSSKVSIDNTNGVYVAPSSDPTGSSGAWVRQYTGLADVRWFGAALDDATDDTFAFNVALNVANDVLFPEGRAYITDMIQVPDNGNLIGLGVGRSIFSLKSDFNLLASGVVTLGTGENMALIDKIGFECFQPATGTRVDMVQYPWMINHQSRPRVRIGHVRFSRAWNGINATGNCGGVYYDIIESGTLNVGLLINGPLDTMNIGRFRHWPFGIGEGGGGAGDVYIDGGNLACQIMQCDGLAGTIQTYRGRVVISDGVTLSADRYIDEIHVDGDGASIEVSGSDTVKFGYVYSTKSNADVGYLLLASDTSKVFIDNFQATFGIRDRPAIYAAGASTISIGYVNLNDNSAGSGFNDIYVDPAARLKIDAGIIKVYGAKTSPVVSGSGSIEIGSGVTLEIASASTPLWNITSAVRVDLKTPTIIGNPGIGALDWDGVTSVGSYVLKSGRIDGSTDANGLITVAHGSKIPPRFATAIIAGPDTALFLKLVSVDFANAVFKVFTLAGAPYASSGIALEWQIST